MVFLVPRRYREDFGDTVSLAQLERYPLILDFPQSSLREILLRLSAVSGFRPKKRCEAEDVESFASMIKIGMGIAFVPGITFYAFQRNEFDEAVFPVRIKDGSITRKIVVSCKDGIQESPEMASIIDSLKTELDRCKVVFDEGIADAPLCLI